MEKNPSVETLSIKKKILVPAITFKILATQHSKEIGKNNYLLDILNISNICP